MGGLIALTRKNLHYAFILLLWTTLLFEPALLMAKNECLNLQSDNHPSCVENSRQTDMNRINIIVLVPLLQHFSLFSLNYKLTARILIEVDVEQTSLNSYTLEMPIATVVNYPQSIQQKFNRLDEFTTRMVFVIPSDLKDLTIELNKEISIWTIFYRSYAILFPFEISSNIPAIISYELRLILMPNSNFLSGYPSIDGLPDLTSSSSLERDGMGQTIFKIEGIFTLIKVAWESKNWNRNAILILGGMVSILILIFFTPGQLKRRSRLQKISIGLGKAVAVKNKIVEKIANRSTTNTHIKLMLTLSMIMISIPLTVGEDPRTNILVLTSLPVEKEIGQITTQTSDLIKIYTIADERNDLDTISRLQFFDAVIIGDYELKVIPIISTPADEIRAIEFIKTKIVLDQYKSTTLAKWVLETYKDVILVESQTELAYELNSLVTQNKALLGWDKYVRIIQLEAVLSLLVTMLLVTTIIVYLMENNDENIQTNLARTITISIFAFSFMQSLFFTVSRLLIPLSAHAGGRGVTAISYIGPFGGGSYPRMASAMFGFFFAFAFAGKKYDREISWKLFLTLVVTGLALIVDPITGGQLVWTFLLDLTGGAEFAQQSTSAISLLINHIAGLLGSDVQGFFRSRGIMLFFSGVIPLMALGRARKYTTTALIFVCAIFVGWGTMRIGQMMAFTFFASIIPGIFFGMIFAIPFLVLSFAEEKIADQFKVKIF